MNSYRRGRWELLYWCAVALTGGACSPGALNPDEEQVADTTIRGRGANPGAGPNAASASASASASAAAARGPRVVPGQLVVKFKVKGRERLTEDAQTWLSQGRSFATATADGSASLDRLVRRHRVSAARTLLRGRAGLSTAVATTMFQKRITARVAARVTRRVAASGTSTARAALLNAVPELVNIYRLEVPAGADLDAVAAEFARDPHVEYAHPNYVADVLYTPNDPFLASSGSWGQPEEDLWNLKQIGAETAWDSARGAGVVVAVVDTGVDVGHPDLAGNIWNNEDEIAGNGVDDDANGYVDDVQGWNTFSGINDASDGNGHGTHVAGTIAAQDNNGMGVVGVAPDARIMPVKAINDRGEGDYFSLAEGVIYAAANGAHVMNNSWGCKGVCAPVIPEIEDAVAFAYAAGTVIVFAAGNEERDVRSISPHNRFEVLTVSALYPNEQRASFSNFGLLDVAAPGAGTPGTPGVEFPEKAILSLKSAQCDPGFPFLSCPQELVVAQDYLRQSGTSMAAPHVAGLAALVRSQHPEYSLEQVRQVIRTSTVDVGAAGFDLEAGYGRIDAARAVQAPVPLASVIFAPRLLETPSDTTLTGTAAGPGFAEFTLDYGSGNAPTSWTTIRTSTTAVTAGALGTWQVSTLPDGDYTVRLRATTSDNRTYDDRTLVALDRVKLSSPKPMSFHKSSVVISGTASPPDMTRFDVRVERLSDGAPLPNADIRLTGNGGTPVTDGVLATWVATGVPADHYRVILDVTLGSGVVVSESAAIVVDSKKHDGWPLRLEDDGELFPQPVSEHTVLADLDGDGRAEHLVGYGSLLNVFRHDGTQLPGWPQRVDTTDMPWVTLRESPAVGDVNGDGELDVVVASTDGRLWVWNANGSVHPGWPRDRGTERHDVTLADVDRNGVLEIVITDLASGLDVLRSNGTSLPGFPVTLGWGVSGAATVADLDRDGDMEIVASLDGGGDYVLYAFDHQGRPLRGFPQTVAPVSNEGTYPVVGDLDDNGDLEIVVAAAGWDPSAARVAAYNHDGTPLAGWPQQIPANLMSPPVLADLDGDGSLEVLVGATDNATETQRGALFVWNGAGQRMPGWPVYTPSSLSYSPTPFFPPAVFDADGDGRGEVIVARPSEFHSPELSISFGHPLQGYEHDGTPIPALARPLYGDLPCCTWDTTPGIADTDGDGQLELVWLEDRTSSMGGVFAHSWDLDTPATAKQSWPMFRGNPRHSGVAEPVVPIVRLRGADRDRPRTVDGLARFRVRTGAQGIIQIAHPWREPVRYAFNSDTLRSTPLEWGGPIQAQPFTEYLVRVVTPRATEIRISWW